MRILVTGGLGTLGRPLVAELRRRGHDVYSADVRHDHDPSNTRADVGNYRQMECVIIETSPDLVYHLAAEFGRINGEEFYEQLWRTNVIGTRNVLELQRQHGFRLVFTSSSEIYGELDADPLMEIHSNQQPLHQPNDYAISKRVNEQQIINFERAHGNEVVRLRLFNAYGPGEFYHAYRSVVCLFCYRALRAWQYDVYEGYHRVFMYIDDLIPTMANVADHFVPGEVYNIGGTEYRSVRKLSDLVLEATGMSPKLARFLPEDMHNRKSKRPDIGKARAFLGHNPTVTLEEGIPRTIEWMRSVYGL